MRTVFIFIFLIAFSFSLSACNDSAKLDELTKANAVLATELQECRESQKNAALKDENAKKAKDNLKKYENFKSDGPTF